MSTATALIRKSFPASVKVVDAAQGLVEAIVNTTGITDLQDDVLEVGAWDGLCKAMAAGETEYPTILWGHNWDIPVGKVLHAEELPPGDVRLKALKSSDVAGGLRIVGQYNFDTQRGREAYSDVSKRLIPQWSVGFMPAEDGEKHDTKGVRHISKVGMWPEVSNVLVGASPGTRTTATKSAEEIFADKDLPIHEKALAAEQAYLAAVEEGGDGAAVFEALLTAAARFVDEHVGDKYIDTPPIQPQAETTAEAGPSLEVLEARLLQMVRERLNAPPQHNDPEDSGDDGLPAWANYNVALPKIH